MKTLSLIGYTILTILAVDIAGFILWVMSGYCPLDGFYVGSITAHTLRAIGF